MVRSGCSAEAAHGLVGVPVGAEQVGTEVADEVGPRGSRGTISTTPSGKPTASVVGGAQHHPGGVRRACASGAGLEAPASRPPS